jgi:hypothetical protein
MGTRLEASRLTTALITLGLAACSRSVGVPPPRAKTPRAVSQAKAEFELLASDYAAGTSKLYSRGDFLPLDDPQAMSEGDFIGRLRALFGVVQDDEYVLRHRATGFVVTAYDAQSGPSYGGGPRYPGALPTATSTPAFERIKDDSSERAARIRADPLLSKEHAVDWSKNDPRTLSPERIQELREHEHTFTKRFNDVAAPPGFDKVVARLDALLSAVLPADWEAVRYWGDDPTVYREGARAGAAFSEELSASEGVAYLLSQAAQETPPIKDNAGNAFFGYDDRVVAYWVYQAEQGHSVDAALPQVQAAWFRAVAHSREYSADVRKVLLDEAKRQSVVLRLDARKADAALRAAAKR